MRIISGSAGGVPIESPKGRDIRPTLDRVRESVFNILTPWLDDETIFLDLFTGTGANGLEAASRGVKKSILVDSTSASLSIARRNIEKTKLGDQATCERALLPDGVPKLIGRHGPIDVIYADPPFAFEDYEELLQNIAITKPYPAQQLTVIEHSDKRILPERVEGLLQYRRELYGQTAVTFFERS